MSRRNRTVKIEAKIPKPLFETFQDLVVKGMRFKTINEALEYCLRNTIEELQKIREYNELKAKVALLEDAVKKLSKGNKLIATGKEGELQNV